MEIGERIKQRREELGMTQDELARAVGYKWRSSINKIELNAQHLPQRKIVAIAEALKTSPSYLMGWLDEKEEPITIDSEGNVHRVSETPLSEQKRRLLFYADQLDEAQLDNLVSIAKMFAGSDK